VICQAITRPTLCIASSTDIIWNHISGFVDEICNFFLVIFYDSSSVIPDFHFVSLNKLKRRDICKSYLRWVGQKYVQFVLQNIQFTRKKKTYQKHFFPTISFSQLHRTPQNLLICNKKVTTSFIFFFLSRHIHHPFSTPRLQISHPLYNKREVPIFLCEPLNLKGTL
jgi:hypothetical protein